MSEELIINRLEALEKRIAALEATQDRVTQFPTHLVPRSVQADMKINDFKLWCKERIG